MNHTPTIRSADIFLAILHIFHEQSRENVTEHDAILWVFLQEFVKLLHLAFGKTELGGGNKFFDL